MNNDALLEKAHALKLYGMIAHWDKVYEAPWVADLLAWEDTARIQRSLERRLKMAHFEPFKPYAQFDWNWPQTCDRAMVEDCMQLSFLKDHTNVCLCGPSGAGKTTLATNMAHHAVLQGHTALFVTASAMLNDLAAQDGDNALRRRLKYYTQPAVLVLDEVGYLSYSNRHADLLFAIISRRYQRNSTIVTTNKAFVEWNTIFPNAACVVSLIDRLVHRCEIISIEADSFRVKEAKALAAQREADRRNKTTQKKEKAHG